jgi:hypothetical protein
MLPNRLQVLVKGHVIRSPQAITPLMYIKGFAAPESKAAVERARLLIEEAEALGEPPEDPLLLFSVLYGLGTRELFGSFDQRRALQRALSGLAPPSDGLRLGYTISEAILS